MKELDGLISIAEELLKKVMLESFDENNEFKIEDKVILGLYQSIINKSKSISILYNNQHYDGGDLLIRSIFEATVFLNFITKQHTQKRALAYYLSIQLKEIEIGESINSSNDTGEKIRRYLSQFTNNVNMKFLDEKETIEKIKTEFLNLTSKKKSDGWLAVQNSKKVNKKNGEKIKLSSFKDLCEFLGEDEFVEYEIIYRLLSQETHAKDIKGYYSRNTSYLELVPKDYSDMVISLAKAYIIEASKLIAKKYGKNKYYHSRMQVLGFQRYLNKR